MESSEQQPDVDQAGEPVDGGAAEAQPGAARPAQPGAARPEDFEDDPARNPDSDALRDIKGG